MAKLRGPEGLGSAYYDLIVERHGLAGGGFVDSTGSPTGRLIARQGQARVVPQDEQLKAFVPPHRGAMGHRGGPDPRWLTRAGPDTGA